MTQIRSVLTRANALVAAGTLVFAAALTAIPASQANALSLLDRSLMVTSTVASDDTTAPDGSTYTGLVPGDSRNGGQVGHEYVFDVGTAGDIYGFTIEYCDSAFGYVGAEECNDTLVTNDFSAASWDGDAITIEGIAFTISANAVDNFLTFTADTAFIPAATTNITIDMPATVNGFFVNPNETYRDGGTNGTYFAHISTYSSLVNANAAFIAPTPTIVDEGTVTNNVTQSVSIYTRVQETLNFSVEGDEARDGATASVGPCDPLTVDTDITMGDTNDALASDTAYDAYSFFRLATNSANGVNVLYAGQTLESGTTLSITEIGGTAVNSTLGTEQFGLAFDSAATGHSLTDLSAVAAYANGNGLISDLVPANNAEFAFAAGTPVVIANAPGIVACDTGGVRYVANVSTDTEAGIYTTKINYIASPAY